MKKITRILAAALMMGALATTSCEGLFEENEPNNHEQPEGTTPGKIEEFNASLNYDFKLGAMCAYDVDTKQVVKNTDPGADLVLMYQANYGYVVTQPDSKWMRECFEYNNANYTNTNTCTIQNLGSREIYEFADKEYLAQMSPKSGSIPNLQGVNQVQVEPGDVIAFKTNQGAKGVAQITSLSKLTMRLSLSGYIYYPNK